ncbi:MAG: ATP-binding protein, partial [Caldilineaceae bacterium]|nr:ATP-binding protein [Caldilineaceae bacterium]
MTDQALPFPATPWVVKPLVLDTVYVDRMEYLEYLYRAALSTAERRAMSTVLLGRRRMGKTEIFRRVVNRLFFAQDPHDPKAVVPVYYMFSDTEEDRFVFSQKYLENFMRYYVGFYTSQPDLIRLEPREADLIAWIERSRSLYPFSDDLDLILGYHRSLLAGNMPSPEEDAVNIPRRISDIFDSSIVMFLDEFKNTHLPQNNFRIVGYMQNAVESYTCPHFVTGSAMSILSREILGRGALFGRFRSEPITELSGYWGTELVKRTATHFGATVPELMAPVVAERCGGNPFYISAVIQQSAEQNVPLTDEEIINSTLAVDISSG